MSNLIPSYRVLLKVNEIESLIEVLKYHRSVYGLPEESSSALKKLVVFAAKVETGIKVPDYVPIPTEHRKKQEVSLDSLGASEHEKNSVTGTNTPSSAYSSTKPVGMAANLNESEEQELARLEAAMLAELSAQGNENVVLSERRKVPREGNDTSSDSSLFDSLN